MPENQQFRSIPDISRTFAETHGDKAALICGDQRRSYAELNSDSNRIAQALIAAGVEPGDRVAFLDKNVPEYFTLIFGAAKARAVTVAVNWRLAPPEMAYILNHSRVKLLVVGREFLGHLDEMEFETEPQVVVVGSEAGGRQGFADWLDAHEDIDPELPCEWEDTCYQLYTSGTTGLPKGVELTNRNFFGMLSGASKAWNFDEESINLVAMPLFHIAGSGWGLVGLYSGGTNVLLREVDPSEILKAIQSHRITNALLVPAVLQILLATPGIEATDFSSVRSIIYGASPITEEVLVGAMRATGVPLLQVYGATETTGAITLLRAEDHDPGGPRAHLLRSAGQPSVGVELRIVDPNSMKDCPEGEVGEVWTRSHQNLKAYYADPEATLAVYPEGRDADGLGWLRTGDAGYLRDGYLFIHDRVKDMIVSGAENIYPAEIENALMDHPAVSDVAVIGVPDEKWGETVKAVIVPASGEEASDAELIAWCRERLAHFKCPTSVDRVEGIPRNPSGKILKTELRAPYWEGRERMVN
ncbi:MAG: long-chain-fatty-acid--CoA ligase [Myxococcales bacterium]|nr:long-chain-fatty-acid--CoA ligase [Myxococcales bacterium]